MCVSTHTHNVCACIYMYVHLLEVTKQQTCMSVISKLVT